MNSNQRLLEIKPVDPLIFRDARPFKAGAIGARSLPFPLPSAIAGTLRTALTKQENGDFSDEATIKRILNWQIHGPILNVNDKFYFPIPADAYIKSDGQIHKLLPLDLASGSGVNLPSTLLKPVGLEKLVGKPDYSYQFWSEEQAMAWLGDFCDRPTKLEKKDCLSIERDLRTHVKISSETWANEEGMLFSTEGISLLFKEKSDDDKDNAFKIHEGTLTARIVADDAPSVGIGFLHRIGGEGRFATFTETKTRWPAFPQHLEKKLTGKDRLRMQLVTPAVFDGGWKPKWLDDRTPPGAPEGTRLKLIGACVPRWQVVSGWDLKAKEPKPLHRLAPAGSVYFFEVVKGSAIDIAKQLWLQPVSDNEQKRKDGFGLTLWGAW